MGPLALPTLGRRRTNMALQSEVLDDTNVWGQQRLTGVTADAVTGPDWTATADLLVEDATATNTHLISQNVTLVVGQTYTFSCFLKLKERHVTLGVNSANKLVTFNLTTGAVGASFGSPVATGVIPAPNGYYRGWFAFQATNASESLLVLLNSDATTGGRIYSGDGASGAYAWGAQFEAGVGPSPYIPTTSAEASRTSA